MKSFKIGVTFTIFFLILTHTLGASSTPIRLYALYTPSHEEMFKNFFLPSLQDDFELVVVNEEQTCRTARFMSDGWTDTTIKKVRLIIRAIEENWGNFFLFSDVDIQFFAPMRGVVTQLMESYDIAIQRNNPEGAFCSGFFVCRANEKTLALWRDVLEYMEKHHEKSDQITLNKHLPKKEKNKYNIRWCYLPNSFFGGGTFNGKLWKPGMKLPLPKHPIMHHANYTEGVKNKMKQLCAVRNAIRRKSLS